MTTKQDEKQEMLQHFGAFYRVTGVGRAVRYGSGAVLGAIFDSKGQLSGVDPEAIVALTHAECTRYMREYARQVKEGALAVATVDDYLARSAPRKAAPIPVLAKTQKV